MKSEKIIIIGAGGLGREIFSLIKTKFEIIGFVDDHKLPNTIVCGLPVLGNINWLIAHSPLNLIIGVGNMQIRRFLIEKLKISHHYFPTIIHEKASLYYSDSISLGKGVFIGPDVNITTNVKVNDFSFIHIGCSLHHDTVIEENVLMMPGSRITNGSTVKSNTRIEAGYCV